jgi:predicted component of type VI protein secretion system
MIVQLVVASGSRAGQIIPVPVEKFIVGRAEDCHLKPRSEVISRYHCAILVGDDVVVRDLGSKNGVHLNGEKINAEQKLKNGDLLVVGPLEFYVHITYEDDFPAGLPTGGSHVSWLVSGGAVGVSESTDTVLLDHLKSLNQEIKIEPEQPVLNLLKKFL